MPYRDADPVPEPAPGKKPDPEPEPLAAVEPQPEPATCEVKTGPEETKIRLAMAFYQEALRMGPCLSREVIEEGVRRGHAKRTQSRARSRLRVQKIPPATWQGKWMIALPGDPAVAGYKHRKEKKMLAQQRQGNGRKRQGGSGQQGNVRLAVAP